MKKITIVLVSALTFFTAGLSGQTATTLVISQVYGGGGNSGAPYQNDFIEIFNPTSSPVSLTGWSVQYAAATGSNWNMTALTGIIYPSSYYLVREASTSATGSPLPAADDSGSINMSATAGKVLLCNATSAFVGSCPVAASIVDFVGYGATANCYEGTGPAPAPSNTNAIFRADSGCTDANVNATDFSAAAPVPRNSASPSHFCLSTNMIEAEEEGSGIIVYPNPVGNQLAIRNTQYAISNIEVFDLLGLNIFVLQPAASSRQQILIDISGSPPGVYFLRLKTDRGIINRKFVKQ